MSFLKLEIKSPMQILFSLCPDPSPPQEILVPCVRRRLECHPNLGGREGMGANQLCRIMFGISSQIGRDGHRDIEIWAICQLTEKLFETSLVRWNVQVQIFVQILGDTSISEHLWEWKWKETCIESKEFWHFEYLTVFPESRSWRIVESKIVHS